jgi:hypothetical protein
MASALKFPLSESTEGGVLSILADKLRTRQQNIAEITEMIHVSFVAVLQNDTLLFYFFLNLFICCRLQAFCMMMFLMMLILGVASVH